MTTEYIVEFGDKLFRLSESHIKYDSPNFFSSYFLDSADQPKARWLKMSRDPYLFEIIMRYLNGYQVLPLHPTLVPPHCTPEAALADLRADAHFYQLNGLSGLLSSPINPEGQLAVLYAEVAGQYNTESDNLQPTENLDKVVDSFSFKLSSEQQYQTASQPPSFYTVPNNTKDGDLSVFYSGLLNERIVRRVIQKDGNAALVSNWELLGWRRDYPSERCRRTSIYVKLWARPGLVTTGSSPDLLM
ncbi:hypothetical protein RSAG8_09551, partial [Rhizoctonia solani AG-8 WAC10335]